MEIDYEVFIKTFLQLLYLLHKVNNLRDKLSSSHSDITGGLLNMKCTNIRFFYFT